MKLISFPRRLRPVGALTCAALVLASLGNCSVVLNDGPEQCSVDADCTSRGGRFAQSRCDTARKVCIPAFGGNDAGTDSGVDSGGEDCDKNADCPSPGICLAGKCTSTNSTECSKTLGLDVLDKDQLLLIGLLAPVTGGSNLIGKDVEAAVQVGRDAVQRGVTRGTVTAFPNIAVIRCDENLDLESGLAHLQKLGVRGVIGPTLEGNVGTVLQSTAAEKMLFVTPIANSPLLEQGANLDAVTAGRLFHVRPNRLRELVYFDDAVNKTYELLQAKEPGKFSSLNLAIVATTDPATQEFVAQLKTVLPPAGDVVYHDFSGVGQETAVAAAVVAQGANLVALASDDNSYEALIKAIESQPGTTEPWYLAQQRNQEMRIQLQYENLPPRVFGIARKRPAISDQENSIFAGQFQQQEKRSASRRAEDAYDAFYVSLYTWLGAKKLAGSADPIGKPSRDALAYLFTPDGVATGVSEHPAVAAAIGVLGPNLADLHGASGRLDFDLALGSPNEGALLYCYSTVTKDYCDTGFSFDAETGAVSGTEDTTCVCP